MNTCGIRNDRWVKTGEFQSFSVRHINIGNVDEPDVGLKTHLKNTKPQNSLSLLKQA